MQEISHMQINRINSKKYNILVVKAKTNSLICWLSLKIVVFCHLLKKKRCSKEARLLLVVRHCKSTNHSSLFHCLHGWLHTLRVWCVIILNTSNANRNKSIEISCLQYDQLWVVMKDFSSLFGCGLSP